MNFLKIAALCLVCIIAFAFTCKDEPSDSENITNPPDDSLTNPIDTTDTSGTVQIVPSVNISQAQSARSGDNGPYIVFDIECSGNAVAGQTGSEIRLTISPSQSEMQKAHTCDGWSGGSGFNGCKKALHESDTTQWTYTVTPIEILSTELPGSFKIAARLSDSSGVQIAEDTVRVICE